MNRRSVLIGIGTAGVGFAGWEFREQIESVVNSSLGNHKTETPIREYGGDGFLSQFTLYESGTAKLVFGDDYSCYDNIAVGDTTNLQHRNLGEWGLPRDGELVIDLQAAVAKTKDPTNQFYMKSITNGDGYCLGFNGVDFSFTVPDEWLE